MDKPDDEIPSLDELEPEKVTADGRAYLDALWDPNGPQTREYALKEARRFYTEGQSAHSASMTSIKESWATFNYGEETRNQEPG